MADRDFSLYFHIREKWPFVVDFEGKNAVLVWGFESGAEEGAVGRMRGWLEVEAVEGREHAEFELDRVLGKYCRRG